jgi:glucose/arabinose dehydrogenase
MFSIQKIILATLLVVLSVIIFYPGCAAPPAPPPTAAVNTVVLQSVASGLTEPIAMSVPNDGSNRKFIVDQTGKILILDANNLLLVTPFLDVSSKLFPIVSGDERGLLGLAFHPNYAKNGRFFIKYNGPLGPADDPNFNCQLRISEFNVSVSDPNVADPTSERILLTVLKPQSNHNGGNIAFGPDGFLYIGFGDGGAANDVGFGHTPTIGNGQDKTTLLGKILRIDVDNGTPYGIPADNPFVNQTPNRPEIWAYGFRNPYVFSFDAGGTHQLFVGDVGQNLFEEVDIVTRGGDYGWNIREGFHCFDPANPTIPPATCSNAGPDGTPLTDPILEYAHVDSQGKPFGIAIIGGFVYRGSAIPGLAGNYIFGDLSTVGNSPDGSLFAAIPQSNGTWVFRQLNISGGTNNRLGRFVTGIGQDTQGELYLMVSRNISLTGTAGEVLKIISGQ